MADDVQWPSLAYENGSRNLLAKVENSSTLAKIREAFHVFFEDYTVIPFLWNVLLQKERTQTFEDYQAEEVFSRLNEIKMLARTQFYFSEVLDYDYEKFKDLKFGRAFKWVYLNDYSNDILPVFFDSPANFPFEAFYEALTFPHDKLESFKFFAEQYFTSPLSINILKKYEQSKAIFEEIIRKIDETSNNLAGLEVLITTQNENLIIENFECALGMISCDQRVWKLYFNYLQTTENNEKLLYLYSRYCRLFIEDLEMRNNYKSELEKQAKNNTNITKWLNDLIEIERCFGKSIEMDRIFKKMLPVSQKNYSSNECMRVKQTIEFDYKMSNICINIPKHLSKRFVQSPITQNFSLPLPLIRYIVTNCGYGFLKKLISICKFLFIYNKPLFCHNLAIFDEADLEPSYISESLFFKPISIDTVKIKNLTVTNSLNVFSQERPDTLSKILSKVKLNIKYFHIKYQTISFSDFQILTRNQNLEKCIFKAVNVQREDRTILDIADIIKLLPTVKDLGFYHMKDFDSFEISHKLSSLEKNIKFNRFYLHVVNVFINCTDFIEFIQKNATENAFIAVYYSDDLTRQQKDMFTSTFIGTLPNIQFRCQG